MHVQHATIPLFLSLTAGSGFVYQLTVEEIPRELLFSIYYLSGTGRAVWHHDEGNRYVTAWASQ